LGAELRGLAKEVGKGQVPLGGLEGMIRRHLWHVGAQAFGVMVEALDRDLDKQGAVQDYRTRTVVTLFGPVDVCRARCRRRQGWDYPLDRSLGRWGSVLEAWASRRPSGC
jgi:hypothetical protein